MPYFAVFQEVKNGRSAFASALASICSRMSPLSANSAPCTCSTAASLVSNIRGASRFCITPPAPPRKVASLSCRRSSGLSGKGLYEPFQIVDMSLADFDHARLLAIEFKKKFFSPQLMAAPFQGAQPTASRKPDGRVGPAVVRQWDGLELRVVSAPLQGGPWA
jgi:hypothetical protein